MRYVGRVCEGSRAGGRIAATMAAARPAWSTADAMARSSTPGPVRCRPVLGVRGGRGGRGIGGRVTSLALEASARVSRTADDDLPKFTEGKRLSEVSSWGIGGPAKYFTEVTSSSQLAACLRYCQRHSLRYFVLGKGSNCLFDDRGFDGLVLLNRIDFCEGDGEGLYHVGSGHPFNLLGIRCSKEGFSGLEFSCGIPGTVGGAVYMNAGADGQQTSDVLELVEVVTVEGEVLVLAREKDELVYGYRTSPFQKMEQSCAIAAATFRLSRCSGARERQRLYLDRRKKTQPVTERTAGCVFRNPGGGPSAGALIDQAGLKGLAVGDARVSEVHANFFVNAGNSKSSDMLSLIAQVKERVRDVSGVELKEEIVLVPYAAAIHAT